MNRSIRTSLSAALFSALLLASISPRCTASEARETPMVRAVKRAKPGVANIHSKKTAFAGDSLFSTRKGREVNGMGTGIVIDPRGYILTNHHVVNGVDSLRVTLEDGASFDAKVISFDRKHDLAVIKIKSSRSLTTVPMGTSSDLMLGETVIAIGNAFGYEHTVTAGIISSLSRDVEVNEKQSYEGLLQTDASINPGNSGGPLINLDGEVVGVNVAIRAGAQRIGFAIPIDEARRITAELLSVEQLNHHYHGLQAKDHKSAELREMIVSAAQSGSPAEKAGFKKGDVVIKAAEVDVIDRADFERALLGRSVSDAIEVVVRRDDETSTLSLTLSELGSKRISAKKTTATVVSSKRSVESVGESWKTFGFRLTPLPKSERQLVGDQYRGGLRITAVRPDSPAARNGIRSGDILVGLHIWETVNHENISYVIDHPQLTSFDPLKFYIIRGSETLFGYLHLAR
ncbi:MAG: PDZ domain-containing protein [Planctomycetaceae bacterium]|nr:PDZ domain-containing protein [Planctomycetaceae bacterium]MBT6157076.1 PDZ domain-containing protein [Planctomycetaceae bacterium]MBT6484358.1 PDZ domain-containing protein [Planctomycetaceae bacterium]MBT6498091.1 PDZ domain-containing protein [Planctomycetaceae bacterium]